MDQRDENVGQNGDESGGKGGYSLPPTLSPSTQTSDTRMLERAIKDRWPITDAMRQRLPQELAKIIESDNVSRRNKIAAARALLSADGLNMEQEKRDAGGEVINVNVNDGSDTTEDLDQLSEDQLARRHLEALADSRRSQHASPRSN